VKVVTETSREKMMELYLLEMASKCFKIRRKKEEQNGTARKIKIFLIQ
jgi:hypothetical protein